MCGISLVIGPLSTGLQSWECFIQLLLWGWVLRVVSEDTIIAVLGFDPGHCIPPFICVSFNGHFGTFLGPASWLFTG